MNQIPRSARYGTLLFFLLVIAGLLYLVVRPLPRPLSRLISVTHDFSGIPVTASVYLADLVEPITITEVITTTNDDICVVIVDSRDTKKHVMLVEPVVDPDSFLVFGESFGVSEPGRREIAVESGEEHAFCGLLQRWSRADPVARQARRVYDRRKGGESIEIASLAPELKQAYIATLMLRRLESR